MQLQIPRDNGILYIVTDTTIYFWKYQFGMTNVLKSGHYIGSVIHQEISFLYKVVKKSYIGSSGNISKLFGIRQNI